MASSGGLTSFSFNSNTLSVIAGNTGSLTLALDSADMSAEVGRTVTFTSSDTSTATVAPGTATIQVATHSYSITVTGVSAGSATITATCTDSQGVTWTSTATIAVTNATQVIVAEQSLQDIADSIRTKLGTSDTYLPSEMSAAIDSISGGGSIDLSNFLGLTTAVTGTFTNANGYYADVTHNLGVLPKLAVYVISDLSDISTSSSSKTAVFGFKIQTGQMDSSTKKLNSGIYVDAGFGGYMATNSSTGVTYFSRTSYAYFSSSVAADGQNAYLVDLYGTGFNYSYNFSAYKATTSSITFYHGALNTSLRSVAYKYLIAG